MIEVGKPCLGARQDRQAVFSPIKYLDKSIKIGFAAPLDQVSLHGDPFLAVTLIPAMLRGADLHLAAPVSPRLLASVSTIQDHLVRADSRFHRIDVIAQAQEQKLDDAARKVGCFFSAGVDSFHTLFEHQDEIDQLIFVHGFDVPLDNQKLRNEVAAAIRDIAARLGKPLIEVATNLRAFSDRHADWGKDYHGAGLASVALFLAPHFRKVYVAAHSYGGVQRWGSDPVLDPLWSSEAVEIVHDGSEVCRLEKIARIAGHDLVREKLRVCWQNAAEAANCCRCEKCLRTMVALRLTGHLDRCSAFAGPLDLQLVSRSHIGKDHTDIFLENLEAARKQESDQALLDALESAWASRGARDESGTLTVDRPLMYRGPGHLRVQATIHHRDEETRIYHAAPGPAASGGDSFLCATMIPAMLAGVDLRIRAPVSGRLLKSTTAIQQIFSRWDARFQKITVRAPIREGPPESGKGEVGCFFTGGVDSFYTLFEHFAEIDRLIFVHGFDVRLSNVPLRQRIIASIRAIAAGLGKPALEVMSNIREFSDPLVDWGKYYHGAALASVALFLAPRFRKVYLGSSHSYNETDPWGSHPAVDPLWSTEATELVHDGCELSRSQKIAQIAGKDIVLKSLRVCWQNPQGTYNCGKCEKCLRTMVSLRLAGALDRCTTFPALDLERVARINIKFDGRHYFFDNLHAARKAGNDPELLQALEQAWSRSEWQEEFRNW